MARLGRDGLDGGEGRGAGGGGRLIAHASEFLARLTELARERVLALAAGGLALALLALLKFTSEVAEGDTAGFDARFLVALRAVTEGPGPWRSALRATMLDVTALGDTAMLVLVVLLAAGFLLVVGLARRAAVLIAQIVAGVGLVMLAKALVGRARPDVVTHLASFSDASFPSGHAANSAIVYLSIAAMLARAAPDVRARRYILAVGAALTIAIGVSRLYLGVHWPTDVLAGWAFGFLWLALVGLAGRWRAQSAEAPNA